MKETFLVKHAVGGRAFIDTGKVPVPYTYEQQGDGWLFRVRIDQPERIKELMKWKDELNVFVFQEFETEPTRKLWFYVGDDSVQFNEATGELTIVATSHISYIPEQFSVK
ncbi:hypothetical protein [Paenibacillus roseipurpureus]|uniref:Uncharacterized protein n=1 Tax=Paenibacillus roseopurpureus TaxID=2918901 RepID=A0AA96LP11_9BACL|nr:hypothetical protein [Paenibacillus sp. MBLB1832]WNR44036.1 hypothetical protein MJB10_23545 [Paenibacillus sp. MBLB1832]